ncbi:sulfotransferase [Aliidongia dinghuensis]|uniref:Sulfotransferase n=1 Tax=Aliidongia dinghuensis TaxID=1867774 RepID=A0A8J2YW54_9PROT|nr:sulfotransferase domain-containing protein [Aliidongia dinghuensis]GGF30504.1 sulfotransferase [Aliidongia dinghuensis]
MGKLVWLASYPKSGNTWLRALLHNYLRQPAEPWDINRLTDFTAGDSDAKLYQHYDPRPASTYSIADVQRLRPLVHRDLTQAFPGPVFVKTHNMAGLVEGVPLVTPDLTAGAIYMLRDPRDVAISYSHHMGLSLDDTIAFLGNPEAAVGGTDAKVYEKHSSWSNHVLSWTPAPSPHLLVLRYEDLQADPVKQFGRVIHFLSGRSAPERVARAVEFSRFDVLSAQEQAQGFAERPAGADRFFRSGRVGEWHEGLSADQVARIERDHGAVMARFGYL